MKKKYLLIVTAIFSFHSMLSSQTVLPLYEGKIPNAIPCSKQESSPMPGRVDNVTVPTLTVYLPEKSDSAHTAVIICPGGGYARLAIGHEGYDVAKAFNKLGITAFVLKYRIPNDQCMTHKEVVPLQDAERAIQLVRSRAKEWGIEKVGIMGFSAGGHLASTLGTHFNQIEIDNPEHITLRPDFMILGYPVVSFDTSIAHMGSRINLIGKNPPEELVKLYSNELQVTPETPITFIVHASDDQTVPVENSIRFYQALVKNKVKAEIHFYQAGGHGFGLHNKTTTDQWFDRLTHWMMMNKLMKGDVTNP
ncbi:MAG: alpha/beta hydrolase [Bacteroidota bacterium]|nr:alpha/beta hydrolase [Bacteroidota bacterium]